MAINITSSHGAQIKIGNGASIEVFTAIEGVFNGPRWAGIQQNVIEARCHSQDGTTRLTGVHALGDVTFSIYLDSTDTQHLALFSAAEDNTITNFQYILNDEGDLQFAFAATVSIGATTDVDGINTCDVTLHMREEPTRT